MYPEDPCFTILEEGRDQLQELKVTFFPPLYQQRRMWILDLLRREGITDVLDVGCGEGQLLATLCQPAPWLPPPPVDILPPSPVTTPPSPTFKPTEDLSIHPARIAGLDISLNDLEFAIKATVPPPPPQIEMSIDDGEATGGGLALKRRLYTHMSTRWEEMEAKIWKGGLQVVNEDFVNVECIVSTEVIEHLPEDIFQFFAPVLLGVYHPRVFLLTTPSYTFNARFTSPTAPPSARRGFKDPTGRTERIFRHDDHKFEWTVEEFTGWCEQAAREWGYEVQRSDVGKATEVDEWERDKELGGATLVAAFRRIDDPETQGVVNRERRGREVVNKLVREAGAVGEKHELLVNHRHEAYPSSQHPVSLKEIGDKIKATMEAYREGFMRLEELWFEGDIAILCGGWIELLVRAAEEHDDLVLKRDSKEGRCGREDWVVEIIGAVAAPRMLWPTTEDLGIGSEDRSIEYMAPDWIPTEEAYADSSDGGADEDWDEDTTGGEGDISWNNSDDDGAENNSFGAWPAGEWAKSIGSNDFRWGGAADGGWGKDAWNDESRPAEVSNLPVSSNSSAAGWDGDNSDETTS